MALVQLTIEDRPTVRDNVHWEVQTKAAWADDWRVEPYLTPLSASRAVAPGMSRAEFRYDYGEQTREDDPTFAIDGPLTAMAGRFVRIRQLRALIQPSTGFIVPIHPPATPPPPITFWTGIIAGDIHDIQGNVPETSQYLDDPRGTQRLVAFGLEYLLDRLPVEGGYCYATDQSPSDFYIPSTPTFNARAPRGPGITGNRHVSLARFCGDETKTWWRNTDVAAYLLYFCRQPYGHDAAVPTFELAGQSSLLDHIIAVHDFAGLTVWQALNHLVERTRGLGFMVDAEAAGDVVGVRIFSVLGEPVVVGDLTIDANPDVTTIDVDDTIDFEKVVVRQDTKVRFHRVVAQGERVKTMFTVMRSSGAYAGLDKGWEAGEETSYRTLAGGSDATENDGFRRSEALGNVYQRFVMPVDWDWKDRNGIPVNQMVNETNGELMAASQGHYWPDPARTFEPFLPYLVPYSGNTTEYMRPLVWLRCPDYPTRWYRADQPGDMTLPRCTIRMLDDALGIEIKPSAANHEIAHDHFDTGGEADSLTPNPTVDFETMLVTVCLATDERLRVAVNSQDYADAENPKTLTLDVPDAEVHVVIGGTLYNVDSTGAWLWQNATSTVRDDKAKVQAVAALAWAWYGQDRSQVELTIQGTEPLLQLGSYLRTVSNSYRRIPVGTIVTGMAYDFTTNKSRVRTGYWQLDVQRTALNVPGMSDARSVGRTFAKLTGRVRALEEHTGGLPVRWGGYATPVGTADDPLVMLPADLATETAQTDTWDRTDQGANDGTQETRVTRVVYNDAGDQILYAFYRTFTYDSLGDLLTWTAETRVTVDAPGAC